MDNKHDGLWQGGPWEQPSQPVPNLPYICLLYTSDAADDS